MTTQTHKWLPSEPTEQILDAMPQYIRRNALIRIYKAMWQAAPEVEQEPVAYAYKYGSNFMKVSLIKQNNDWIPLYTHPQQKREPLRDGTILGIARTIPNLSGDDNALLAFARELGV